MQNFIVLGIVPGTHFQTTFLFWILVSLGIIGLPIIARLLSKLHTVRTYLAARKVARLINQYELA